MSSHSVATSKARHTMSSCSVDGCSKPVKAKQVCSMHCERLRRRGTTSERVMPTVDERFWAFVAIQENGCWQWTGSLATRGYAKFRDMDTGGFQPAHRWAYARFRGPIPEGLVIDHLCRNTGCVNPEHLEPVTSGENTRRGIVGVVTRTRMRTITHCPKGHPYDAANTYRRQGRESRGCRTCRNQASKEYLLRKAAR